jgi:hypothetical protein
MNISISIDGQEFPVIGDGDEGKAIAVKDDCSGYELVPFPTAAPPTTAPSYSWPFINPESYGLKAVGVTGADPVLNKAALEAAMAAGPVWLPPKSYQISGLNPAAGKAVLIGCGSYSNLIVTGAGSGIHITVSAGNVGTILRDFSIEPASAGGGTYGIHLEKTAELGYMANWEISGVHMALDKPFGKAPVYIDNHINVGPSFFTGTVEKCRMTTGPEGGIVGQNLGDSILIRKNVISGGVGVAINCTQVPGARQLVIEDNNLTSRNGQIYLEGCSQPIAHRNWCEHPAYMGEFAGGAVVKAQITLASCYMGDVSYNTIAGGSGRAGPNGAPVNGSAYGIRLTGITQLAVIGGRNSISTVGIAHINDVSTSGTNLQILTGPGANVLV